MAHPLRSAPFLVAATFALAACTANPTAEAPLGARTTTTSPLVLTPATRGFAVSQGGPSPVLKTVSLTSSTPLTGLAVGTIGYGPGASGWLTTATLNRTTTPATLTLIPTPGGIPVGSYIATVPITAVGASNNPQQVTVTLNVTSSPWILLSLTSRNFSATQGGPQPNLKTIDITNGGTVGTTLSGLAVGTVSYKVGEPTGWLTTASLNTTTAPARLTLRPTPGSLLPGNYTATVPITATGARNNPANVKVILTVRPAPPLIVFSRYTGASALTPATGEIWKMDSAGGNQVQLTSDATFDGEPDLTADRQWIVFTTARAGNLDLYQMKADGSGVAPVVQGLQAELGGRWSPSGARIAYQVNTVLDCYDIHKVDPAGTNDSAAVIGNGCSTQPAWSPDGLYLAWAEAATVAGARSLHRQVMNGSILLTDPLQALPPTDADEPAWSPDGVHIVFSGFRSAGIGGHGTGIWVMDAADGAHMTELTTTGTNVSPTWSPDGGRIIFARFDGSQWDLWLMDADGQHPVNLTNTPNSNEVQPSWR